MHLKKSKNQKQTERKRRDLYLGNGGSFHYCGKDDDLKHCYGDSQCVSPQGIHQHKQNRGPDTLCYMQTQIACMHMECSHPSNQISVCPALSGTRSEINGHTSHFKESSNASNAVQSMESSHGPPFKVLEEMRGETIYLLLLGSLNMLICLLWWNFVIQYQL